MKPTLITITPFLLSASFLAAGLLGGCGGKEEPPPVVAAPPPPPPAPPPPPPVRSIADLMAELRIDPRVDFPEDRAPRTTAERRAILEFFDAFARADHQALARLLDPRDKRELELMVKSGNWEEATKDITRIEIYQTGPSPTPDGDCVIALFEVDFDFQPQMWYYNRSGEAFTFKAAPTPPHVMRELSGEDWIAAWHAYLLREVEIAMQPDSAVTIPQRVIDEAGESGVGSPGAPGTPAPGGPSTPGTPVGQDASE